jgi:hypothetical protein
MARCIVERERQLWALNEEIRAGVQAEELTDLRANYQQHEAKVDRLRRTFGQQEQQIRQRIDGLEPIGPYEEGGSGSREEGYTSASSYSSHPSSYSRLLAQQEQRPDRGGQRDDRRGQGQQGQADRAMAEAESLRLPSTLTLTLTLILTLTLTLCTNSIESPDPKIETNFAPAIFTTDQAGADEEEP